MSKEPIQIGECVPERQSHVASQMDRAEEIQAHRQQLLCDLTECLDKLSVRITEVIRDDPPSPSETNEITEKEEKEEAIVYLASKIRGLNNMSANHNRRLEDAICSVHRLTDLVEL